MKKKERREKQQENKIKKQNEKKKKKKKQLGEAAFSVDALQLPEIPYTLRFAAAFASQDSPCSTVLSQSHLLLSWKATNPAGRNPDRRRRGVYPCGMLAIVCRERLFTGHRLELTVVIETEKKNKEKKQK
eukprot:TRINITY_DN27411_c0_g1_i1.p2 TRINITY_DN27411_c0_g1~~TRINITY_DN27411_c0_g1_i1.p2  ORF type:complete len:130 (+),score=10.21 TRINITY_DN27411_c0_g1_i1:260-649(+)